MPSRYIEYSTNNSGGKWWLTDDDWYALEKAGWKVHWVTLDLDYENFDDDGLPLIKPGDAQLFVEDGRYLGALATKAYFKGTMYDAIESFRNNTSCYPEALGCPCCGPPHSFTEYHGSKWIRHVSPEYPDSAALSY